MDKRKPRSELYDMKVKDLKKLVKAFDQVENFDFIKDCWTYNEYLYWGATLTGINKLEEVKK
jgi:hypothetical protein